MQQHLRSRVSTRQLEPGCTLHQPATQNRSSRSAPRMPNLIQMKELETVDFYQADARSTTLHQLLKTKYVKFDTIISDMAPNFSGTLF